MVNMVYFPFENLQFCHVNLHIWQYSLQVTVIFQWVLKIVCLCMLKTHWVGAYWDMGR